MSLTSAIFFDHRHHLLNVRGCISALDVLGFEGHEELSKPFRYAIEFTSTDKAIEAKNMLMQDASLTLQAPVIQGGGMALQQPLRVIQGIVTGLRQLSTSRDEARYELMLQPRLVLLARSHQNSIYQDMSVPQIVEKILRERHDMRGQDFVFTLAGEYPRREQVMQFGEDDLTFISRLLSEIGIWFRFTTDTRLNIDVVEFCDDQRHYQQGLTLPAVPPSGMHDKDVESVWSMESRHRVVEKSVSTLDYNYRAATDDLNARVDVTRGDVTTYGEAYHYADNYLIAGSVGREPAAESGAFYARIRHERYLNAQTQLIASSSCATLVPGMELKVTGSNAADIFHKGVVVTKIITTARRDRSFEVAVEAIPFSEDYGFRPAIISKPTMAGTLPARVTSTQANDMYGHIDKYGRYKVNMLFDRAIWPGGEESLWVRQSRPYAGDTHGLHLPLLAGTEVAIGFEGGDPDRPYIAGVLHDSAHIDHVTIRNYRRNVLRTPANNKIRLDDTRGQEHIKVSTEYGGKTQLNLGYLVDSEKRQRGEGFELRTDSWGAIRAQKGIFISADGQPKAIGAAQEMQPAINLLRGAVIQLQDWEAITKTHYNISPDVSTLKHFSDGAQDLQKPAFLVSAPQGIGMVTPESILLQSSNGLYLQSLNDVTMTSGNRFSVNTRQAISVLSQKEGMRLVSAKGPLNIESHGDILSLTSLKDVTIQSSQGHLQFIAKNGITLGCGGAYIRLTPQGEIKIHGPGLLSLKGKYQLNQPASEDFPLPDLPASICEDCLKYAQSLAQGFVPRSK